MSTKNIKYTNRETYLQKSESMLLLQSDAYFNKKKFLLGKGAEKDKVIFYLQMNNSLCTYNCDMIKFIEDKIKGKVKEQCKTSKDVKCCDTKIIPNYY